MLFVISNNMRRQKYNNSSGCNNKTSKTFCYVMGGCYILLFLIIIL